MSPNWQLKVEELDLSKQHLTSIENLEGLINLRVANFSFNRLESMKGIS